MTEPMWIQGDPIALSNGGDSEISVDCECGWNGEVSAWQEYSHGEVTVYAEWKCPNCDESHTTEYWYDPRGED